MTLMLVNKHLIGQAGWDDVILLSCLVTLEDFTSSRSTLECTSDPSASIYPLAIDNPRFESMLAAQISSPAPALAIVGIQGVALASVLEHHSCSASCIGISRLPQTLGFKLDFFSSPAHQQLPF